MKILFSYCLLYSSLVSCDVTCSYVCLQVYPETGMLRAAPKTSNPYSDNRLMKVPLLRLLRSR